MVDGEQSQSRFIRVRATSTFSRKYSHRHRHHRHDHRHKCFENATDSRIDQPTSLPDTYIKYKSVFTSSPVYVHVRRYPQLMGGEIAGGVAAGQIDTGITAARKRWLYAKQQAAAV